MTAYTIPPAQTKIPLILNNGDTLTVDLRGRSTDVTVNDGASESVNVGGSSFRTTVNDGGMEFVNGGTADVDRTNIDFTTINGGGVILNHAAADHTRVNFLPSAPLSQMDVVNHSVAKNTIIEGGGILPGARGITVDATSIADNVTFERPGGKGAGVGLADPQNLKGVVKGLAVNDYLQFGGLAPGDNVNVTSFTLTNNRHELTITYGNNQHATYHLTDLQANTTFELVHGTGEDGTQYSELVVVKAPAPAALTKGNHTPSEFDSPLVGVDAHHFHFGPGPFG
jgi:autotransporter passenger strand-loop-strand repeat protein